jgi:PAS domain S-box-containing protein
VKILLVDDVEDNRSLWERVLTKAGFEVLLAANGEEALEQLQSGSIDMVISDVLMPVMDGFRLCAAMKRNERLKSLPFVFLTGTYTAEEDENLALRLGADRFVRKPIGTAKLVEIVRDVAKDIKATEVALYTQPQADNDAPELKLYSKRLIHKLETKMFELQEEIARREQAEKIIVRAKREWERTFDAVNDMIMIADSEFRVRRANIALAKKLGATPKEIVGRYCYEIIHGLDEPPSFCPHLRLRKDRRHHSMEYVEDRLGGAIQVNSSLLLDDEGNTLGAVHVFRDINERKLFEEKLQEHNRFLNDVLEALSHPFYVIDAENYSIKLANSAARLGNLTEASTCYGLTHHMSRPCEGTEHPCPVTEVKRTGESVRVEHVHYDKENSPRNVAVYAYPLVNETGTVKEVIEYCIDITDRRKAELALRESEERFRALFETTPDCVFIKDRSLRYTHVNPAIADLFGIPASAFIGKTDQDLYGEWTGSHLQQMDSRVLKGESVDAEHTRAVSGNPVTFHDIRVPLRNDSGEIIGVYGISRNITERKRRTSPMLPAFAGDSRSKVMQATFATAEVAGEKGGIILLLGESGAGKDYIARYIHEHSPRRSGPYFTVNCAALPPELAESELFGYEPGAFTSATKRKRGLLELAEGGTLLLNEIGDLSLSLQAKLLTFLDTRSFTRVGGEKTVVVDARLLAATNKDLDTEIKAGRFRQDLYYRINVLYIRVPPLRERREDIPYLIDQILARLLKEMQLHASPTIDPQAMNALMNYEWPGNVRELRNVLERALMLWRGGPLDIASLKLPARGVDWSHTVRFPKTRSLYEITEDVTKALVTEALRRTGGSKLKAAATLGISRYTLFRLLKGYGLDVRD